MENSSGRTIGKWRRAAAPAVAAILAIGIVGTIVTTYSLRAARQNSIAEDFERRNCILIRGEASVWDRRILQLFGREAVGPCVYLEAAPGLSDADLTKIGELSNLESLYLSGSKITDEGIAAIRPLCRLKALWLDQTAVTDRGLGLPPGSPRPQQPGSHASGGLG